VSCPLLYKIGIVPQGTPKDEVRSMDEKDTDLESTDDVVSDGDMEAMIDAELRKPDEKEKGKEAADKAGADTTEQADGTGKTPPDDKQVQATAAAEADKAFLRDIGLDGEEVTPKELERLKKVNGFYSEKVKTAEGKANWFGQTNKQLSEEVKKLRVDHGKMSLNQPITIDEIKLFREKNKSILASLPEGAKRLWDDDDYVADKIATMRFMSAGSQSEQEQGNGGQGASAPVTEDQARAQVAQTIAGVASSEIIKASHPDIGAIYSSQDFQKWAATLSDFEVMKIFSGDPRAHKEVLDRYKAERSAAEVSRQQADKSKKNNDALRTHGAPAGGGAPDDEDDYSPSQILNDPKAFQNMKLRIRQNRVRGG
jgi:hypothetical protein